MFMNIKNRQVVILLIYFQNVNTVFNMANMLNVSFLQK